MQEDFVVRWRVFVYGDSISVHYGSVLEKSLPTWCDFDRKGGVARALENLDEPQGSNGGDSSMMVEYFRERSGDDGFRPDLVLLNAGLHDIKRAPHAASPTRIALEDYRKNLTETLDLLAGRGVAAAWIRTTPLSEELHNGEAFPGFYRFERDLADYNAAADSVMAERGIPVIDLAGFTRSQVRSASDLFCDHVHFKDSIRELQGAFLAGWVISFFQNQKPKPNPKL